MRSLGSSTTETFCQQGTAMLNSSAALIVSSSKFRMTLWLLAVTPTLFPARTAHRSFVRRCTSCQHPAAPGLVTRPTEGAVRVAERLPAIPRLLCEAAPHRRVEAVEAIDREPLGMNPLRSFLAQRRPHRVEAGLRREHRVLMILCAKIAVGWVLAAADFLMSIVRSSAEIATTVPEFSSVTLVRSSSIRISKSCSEN